MREKYIDIGIMVAAFIVGVIFFFNDIVSWVCIAIALTTGYHIFSKERLIRKVLEGERNANSSK